MTPPADAPSAEVLAASRRFGLRPATATRLAGGYQNPTWLLRTRSGRADVLRQYSPYRLGNGFRNDRAIHWEHALLRHLADAGLPVLAPLPTAAGDTLVALGDARWSRFRYAPDTPASRTIEHHLAAVRLLADIHLAARSFQPPAALAGQRSRMGERLDIAEWFMHLNDSPHDLPALLAAAARPAADSPFQQTWYRFLDWLHLALELVQAAREDPALRAVPRQAIHGDYVEQNLGFDAHGGITAVYDFDETALDLRVIDVAKYVSYASQRPTGRFDLDVAARLLAAYHERLPLTAPELRHFVPAMLSVRLQLLLSTLAQQVLDPSTNHARGIDHWGRALSWILAQRHEWTALATSPPTRSMPCVSGMP